MSKEKDIFFEQVAQVPVCHIIKDVCFFMSQHMATGNIDNRVPFEICSNLDGAMVIELGDKGAKERYIVNVREVVEAAYEDYKKRRGL